MLDDVKLLYKNINHKLPDFEKYFSNWRAILLIEKTIRTQDTEILVYINQHLGHHESIVYNTQSYL